MQLSLALCVLPWLAEAQSTSNGYVDRWFMKEKNSVDLDCPSSSDPFLQYRPEFARSLPTQILLSGIVLTLVAVLLVHLIFTAQYHWSLAQVNYVLQLSAAVTLLVAHTATLCIILSETIQESQRWPYMLSYAAIHPDPSRWMTSKRAVWHMMFALITGLIQVSSRS